jgi:zinc transport system permease protein
MALGAGTIGALAVAGGMTASWFWDTPTGPSVVVVAALLFALGALFRRH